MRNGCWLSLKKGNNKKTFFIFSHDGSVRDMTDGFGKIYIGKEFDRIYDNLINDGYEEI